MAKENDMAENGEPTFSSLDADANPMVPRPLLTVEKESLEIPSPWSPLPKITTWRVHVTERDGKALLDLLPVDSKTWVHDLAKIERDRCGVWETRTEKPRISRRGDYVIRRKGITYKYFYRRSCLDAELVTVAPFWGDVMALELKLGNVRKVWNCFQEIMGTVAMYFPRMSRREAVGINLHLDTHVAHMDIWTARITQDLQWVPGYRRWIGLVGPWTCAVHRQMDWGFARSTDLRCQKAVRNVEKEVRRHGQLPVDLRTARLVDKVVEKHFGRSAFREQAFQNYAANYLKRAEQHLAWEIAALEKMLAVKSDSIDRKSREDTEKYHGKGPWY